VKLLPGPRLAACLLVMAISGVACLILTELARARLAAQRSTGQ
jgi:hypothetical protein